MLKVGVEGVVGRVEGLQKEVASQDKTITALRAELAVAKASSLAGEVRPLPHPATFHPMNCR